MSGVRGACVRAWRAIDGTVRGAIDGSVRGAIDRSVVTHKSNK